jgi:hypothetical protein
MTAIDRALLRDVQAGATRIETVPGSDHRALLAKLV